MISPLTVIPAAVLVMLSGLFSGLNLGLMSFSDEDLRIIVEGSPDEQERRDAATIQPLQCRHRCRQSEALPSGAIMDKTLSLGGTEQVERSLMLAAISITAER